MQRGLVQNTASLLPDYLKLAQIGIGTKMLAIMEVLVFCEMLIYTFLLVNFLQYSGCS